MDNQSVNQTPLRCESSSSSSRWPSWLPLLSLPALRSLLSRLTAHAKWATLATRLASSKDNSLRYYVAALFVVGLAPFSCYVYRFFDPSVGGPETYWNAYYYLHSGGKDLCTIFVCTGAFVLVKEHDNVRWLFAAVAAFRFTVVASQWHVSSNAEYHAFPAFTFVVACICVTAAWLKLFDFLIWLYNHRTLARITRIQTVARIARDKRIDAEIAFNAIDNEATELKASF